MNPPVFKERSETVAIYVDSVNRIKKTVPAKAGTVFCVLTENILIGDFCVGEQFFVFEEAFYFCSRVLKTV